MTREDKQTDIPKMMARMPWLAQDAETITPEKTRTS
jgi:hypothetical protein